MYSAFSNCGGEGGSEFREGCTIYGLQHNFSLFSVRLERSGDATFIAERNMGLLCFSSFRTSFLFLV